MTFIRSQTNVQYSNTILSLCNKVHYDRLGFAEISYAFNQIVPSILCVAWQFFVLLKCWFIRNKMKTAKALRKKSKQLQFNSNVLYNIKYFKTKPVLLCLFCQAFRHDWKMNPKNCWWHSCFLTMQYNFPLSINKDMFSVWSLASCVTWIIGNIRALPVRYLDQRPVNPIKWGGCYCHMLK